MAALRRCFQFWLTHKDLKSQKIDKQKQAKKKKTKI